jgi:hypothetical protein
MWADQIIQFFSDLGRLSDSLITPGVMWALMAAVQALPAPDVASLKPYVWLYKLAHFFAANIRVVGKRIDVSALGQQSETAAVNAALVKRLKELGDDVWLESTLTEQAPETVSGKE